MTAKEMFEKKGFNLEKSYDETLETYICIQYNFNVEMHFGITFNIERKTYHAWIYGYKDGKCSHDYNYGFDQEMHMAVHTRCKELGWID